jgi:hypothetical protein
MKSAPDSQNGQSILGVYIVPRRRLLDIKRFIFQVSSLMFISSPKKFGKSVVQSQLHFFIVTLSKKLS